MIKPVSKEKKNNLMNCNGKNYCTILCPEDFGGGLK